MHSASALKTVMVCQTPFNQKEWLQSSLLVSVGKICPRLKPGWPWMLINRNSIANRVYLFQIMKFSFSLDVPSEPLNCHVNKTNKDCMFISWDKPESDGGSPITGYYIERKERNSLLWVKANDTVVRTTEYPCASLIEGLEYTFRVSAINRAGQGKPSKKTDFVTARTPVGKLKANAYIQKGWFFSS